MSTRLAPLILIFGFLLAIPCPAATSLRFQIGLDQNLTASPQNGRLFIIIARNDESEPRKLITRNGLDAPFLLAADAHLTPGHPAVLGQNSISSPITNLSQLPASDYFVQALLISNPDLLAPDSPGNLYSDVRKIHLDPISDKKIPLTLNHQIPPEQRPPETDLVKYVKIQSRLLTQFYGRPIFLRAGIILPRDFARQPERRYPLIVRIGGWGARYSSVQSLMSGDSEFRKTWLTDGTPQMIVLQLDGAGPYGDCYQVNSANNGPYGDALTQELIPFVENKFRAIGQPRARVLTGLSTGGWVSLALQIFYPDFFNGTWTFCPDPVDFRAFELINIYDDDNAYTNRFGIERPSERAVNGDVRLTMRREVQVENVLGAGNSWTMSGQQWCTWNAAFGPRGADGRPSILWDPQTGRIDRAVAEQWKKYDLRLVLQENWPTLGPRLKGKLHISVGDADNYFLNNAIHLLDEFLAHADPPYGGRIVYGPGRGHGWRDVSTAEMLREMAAATGEPPH